MLGQKRKSTKKGHSGEKAEPGSYCLHCGEAFKPGEKRHHSHQAGMRGFYHWKCYIEACRQANRIGAQEIEIVTASLGTGEETSGEGIEEL